MIFKKQYFIYLTTNLINGKKYIGKHYGLLNDGYLGSGKIFKEAVQKYGKENFSRQILEFCLNQKDLNEAEKRWIKIFNAVEDPNFYNLEAGGQGGQNYQTLKNWYLNNPEKGKEINLKNAIKVNEWYKYHPEARQKWHDAAMAGYKKWREEHPDEYQQKIEKIVQTQGMKIRCVTTGLEFRSQGEAARFYGMSSTSHLSACLNGKRKHAGKLPDGTKLSWEKIEENS